MGCSESSPAAEPQLPTKEQKYAERDYKQEEDGLSVANADLQLLSVAEDQKEKMASEREELHFEDPGDLLSPAGE
jgi:hypothetical protein